MIDELPDILFRVPQGANLVLWLLWILFCVAWFVIAIAWLVLPFVLYRRLRRIEDLLRDIQINTKVAPAEMETRLSKLR